MTYPFEQYDLQDFLITALKEAYIKTPTPVQEQVIPQLLKGRDVIGHSQTGTGKTFAYLLPIMHQIKVDQPETQVLILAPTRELANQIQLNIQQLAGDQEFDVLPLVGGVDTTRQAQKAKRHPHILVGTPGRVADLVRKKSLDLSGLKFFVIDEADTMMDMGFKEDIDVVVEKMPKGVQRALFSATMPPQVVAIAKKLMTNPVLVQINPGERTIRAIENVYFRVGNTRKAETLVNVVKLYNPYLGIVFCNRKEDVDALVTELKQGGIDAEGLHGDLQQNQRKQVMKRFREARIQVLVATDIAARGLDVEGLTHIFNYDLPANIEQYIHRIGRTGRAGETGIAVSLVHPNQGDKVQRLSEKLNQPFREKIIEKGEIKDKPKGARKEPVAEGKAGGRPGAKPGTKTGGKPGARTSEKPGAKTGGKPGARTSEKPGARTSDKPGAKTGGKPGDRAGAKFGNRTDSKPGDRTGEKFGNRAGKTGGKPGARAGGKPGGRTGGKPGGRPGAKSGGRPGAKGGKR